MEGPPKPPLESESPASETKETEEDRPVITDVSVSPEVIQNGGVITLIIAARSKSPVNFLSRSFDGPTGNIYGGGGTARFKEVSPGVWRFTWTHPISKWSPSGLYSIRGISLRNEARLTSEVWKGDVSVKVVNDVVPTRPVITDVSVSPQTLKGGGEITLTITAKSDSPVTFLNRSFDGPEGNILGGGGTAQFKEVSPRIWRYDWSHSVSKWAPTGQYSFRGVSVRNEAMRSSAVWNRDVLFAVDNDAARTKPVIRSATLSPTTLRGGGRLTLTLTVVSDSPVNFLTCSFDGPAGNIHGGGGTARFKEILPGQWRYTQEETISKFAPSGQYTFHSISVRNAAGADFGYLEIATLGSGVEWLALRPPPCGPAVYKLFSK